MKSKSEAKRLKIQQDAADLKAARKSLAEYRRRPLQVGDRVSFEGFEGEAGAFSSGKGIITSLDYLRSAAWVEADDNGGDLLLGLRSFRRLVPRRGGK